LIFSLSSRIVWLRPKLDISGCEIGDAFVIAPVAVVRDGSADLSLEIAGQVLLARLQELLRSKIVEVLVYAFAPAQLGDAVFATQPVQYNADLLFG
jgi:hypothetical protein